MFECDFVGEETIDIICGFVHENTPIGLLVGVPSHWAFYA
jgi:hypothetical protein